MKILSCVGTRPEIIKNLAFCRAARLFPECEFLLVHTGQNAGALMADTFFRELDIPITRTNGIPIDRSTDGAAIRCLLDFINGAFADFSPDLVMANTDTDTAFLTAWAATRSGLPVAHIEGGIRCEARLNREEINRRLADHLSNWIFTISEEDTLSLQREGFPHEAIFMKGDITLDALQIVLKEHRIEVGSGNYDLLTVHRQENANHPERLAAILTAIENVGFPTLFPVHPRTRQTLENSGLMARLQKSQVIELRDPLGFVEMVRTTAQCRKVLSDSGGLRREAYMLGKPVISLVSFVWFHAMNHLGFEFSADADPDKIAWAIENFNPPAQRPPLFGDGRAAEYILGTLLSRST